MYNSTIMVIAVVPSGDWYHSISDQASVLNVAGLKYTVHQLLWSKLSLHADGASYGAVKRPTSRRIGGQMQIPQRSVAARTPTTYGTVSETTSLSAPVVLLRKNSKGAFMNPYFSSLTLELWKIGAYFCFVRM